MGIEEVATAARSPWQNPYCERVIGTLRRDCLDHVIVLGERHLLHILRQYVSYYHEASCHQSLDGNSPITRSEEPTEKGRVVALSRVGGLHHECRRAA